MELYIVIAFRLFGKALTFFYIFIPIAITLALLCINGFFWKKSWKIFLVSAISGIIGAAINVWVFCVIEQPFQFDWTEVKIPIVISSYTGAIVFVVVKICQDRIQK